MNLTEIAQEIRECVEIRKKELELTFYEDEHIYFMRDLDGKHRNNFPSVSKVIKKFYIPFDAESKAYQMTDGDEEETRLLLEKWKKAGDYSTNLGSRVHYMLETDLVGRYGNYKDVRQPIFECDNQQIMKSDSMISAGKDFLTVMAELREVLKFITIAHHLNYCSDRQKLLVRAGITYVIDALDKLVLLLGGFEEKM